LPLADEGRGEASSYSLRQLVDLIGRRRKFLLGTVGGLLLVCLLYLAWVGVTHRPRLRPVAARLALVGMIAAALLLPLAIEAARDLTSWRYLPYPGTARYVADLAAYVRPGPAQTVLGPRIGRAYDRDLTDTTVFPGYVLLGAGIAVLSSRRTRRGLGFWILLGASAFVLSLGPSLRVAGRDLGWPLPFAVLPHVPVLQHMRAPSRFSILVVLALAVLLSAGWTTWLERVRRPSARLLLTGFHRLVAHVFEIIGEIIDLSRGPALTHINAAVEFRQLRQRRPLPDNESLLRCPPARHRHDAETSPDGGRQTDQAARRIDKLTGTPGLT